jgi:hypothetical protein
MTQAVNSRRFAPLEVLLVAATLLSASWVASRTEKDLETALGLSSTQWLRDKGDDYLKRTRTLRRNRGIPYDRVWVSIADSYSSSWSQSYKNGKPVPPQPVTRRTPIQIIHGRIGIGIRETTLPFLTIASVGLGFVAARRARLPRRRTRWGPGRVAAAISLVGSGAGLAQVFVLRRFDLMKHGLIHDTLPEFWENNAQIVALAILAAWIVLILNGRWRLEPTWREWLGASLGGLWLTDLFGSALLEPFIRY